MERQYKPFEPSFGINKKLVLACALVVCFFIIATSLFVGINKDDDITIVQYPWDEVKVVTSPCFYLKLLGKTTVFKKTGTYTFTVPVNYNDGFPDSIKGEATFTLPHLNEEQIRKVYNAYGGQQKLIEALYKPVTQWIIRFAAASISSEESRSKDFKEFEKLVQEQLRSHDIGAIRIKIIR